MTNILTKEIEKVRDFLLEEPMFIFSPEKGSFLTTSLELVNPREDGSRDIGSVNMIMSSSYIKFKKQTNEEDTTKLWDEIVNILSEEKFLRIKPSVSRSQLRVVS